MKSLPLIAALFGMFLALFASVPQANAGGFALNLGVGRQNVIVANGFNNHGFARQQNVVVLNNRHGFNNVNNFGFNRANVVVASPHSFNAFGTAAVVDRRGNVFQVDPFGNSVLVRGGFNSFGVQSFNSFGGVRTFGGCQ